MSDIRFLEHVEVERKIHGVRPDGIVVVDLYEERNETDGDNYGFCCGHCGAAWSTDMVVGFKGFDFSDELVKET
jgi:hypothetical protein